MITVAAEEEMRRMMVQEVMAARTVCVKPVFAVGPPRSRNACNAAELVLFAGMSAQRVNDL